MKLDYYSNVDNNGLLQKNVSAQFLNDLNHFKNKKVHITIDLLKSKRSEQQNKYWWAVVTILSKEIGYTKNELHEILKFKFLKRSKIVESTGEALEYIESTTKLNKSDFADMTSELIRWSAETFNVILPIPGEQTDLEI